MVEAGTAYCQKRRRKPLADVTNVTDGSDVDVTSHHVHSVPEMRAEILRLRNENSVLTARVAKYEKHVEEAKRRFERVRMEGLAKELLEYAERESYEFLSLWDLHNFDVDIERQRIQSVADAEWPALAAFVRLVGSVTTRNVDVLRVLDAVVHSSHPGFTSKLGWLDACSLWFRTGSEYAVDSIQHHAAPRHRRLMRATERIVRRKKASVQDEEHFRVDERGIVHCVYDQIGRYHYHAARAFNRDVYPIVTIGEAYTYNDESAMQSELYVPSPWNAAPEDWLRRIEDDTRVVYAKALESLLNDDIDIVISTTDVENADDIDDAPPEPASRIPRRCCGFPLVRDCCVMSSCNDQHEASCPPVSSPSPPPLH